jgi:very-short-patch-repair endonuclease
VVPDARSVDAAIARLAGRQYGVVARFQLLAIGLTARMIDRRVATGRLHAIHRGVYAVGHKRIPQEGRWLAAVLACGDSAVLSHRSAAALWGIRAYSGKVLPSHQIDRAVRESEFLGIVDFALLDRMLDAHRRGTGDLRIAVQRTAESTAHTRSELEDRFRTLVLDENLPAPEHNATVQLGENTIEADAVWHEERVIVELDGYAAHATREQFRADRARDRAAQAAGWLVLRYTWADIDARAAAQLRHLLSERRRRRSGRLRSVALSA